MVDKFEQMMAVASEAPGPAMMWMARVMGKCAEEAERRKEGAKDETAAFERAVIGWSAGDGNGAGFAGGSEPGRLDEWDE